MEVEGSIRNIYGKVCPAKPNILSYYMQISQKITSQTSYSFRYYNNILGNISGPSSAFLSNYLSKDSKLYSNAIYILNRSRKRTRTG
jgi:hypothetical protein